MQANEQTDERVAQYFSLDSWLFWTILTHPFSFLKKSTAIKGTVARATANASNGTVAIATASVKRLRTRGCMQIRRTCIRARGSGKGCTCQGAAE